MDNESLTYQFEQLARQDEITVAVNEYKQELLSFLDKEIYFADLDNDATDEYDCWFSAKQYAFQIVRDFIETGNEGCL